MRGARHAKALIVAYLRAEVPVAWAARQVEYGLTADQLPIPTNDQIEPNAPMGLDTFPRIGVTCLRTRTRPVENLPGSGVLYRTTYSMRVFGWVIHREYQETIEVRDDFSGSLRWLLIEKPNIDVADDEAVVRVDTITEEFSDTTKVKGDRWVAGTAVSFDFDVLEPVTRTASGTVQTATVHPALL